MADTTTTAGASDRNPDAIERDIRETQNDISDTVEQLQRRLNPRALIDSLIGDEQQSSQRLLSAARDNPVAVALIGAGALWLASGRGMPSLGGSDHGSGETGARTGRGSSGSWLGRGRGRSHHDPHHQSYLDYMAQHGQRDGESDESYHRRRDLARATYFMVERDHDEDDASFRRRLNEAGERFRNRTSFGEARGSSSYPADNRGGSESGMLERARHAFSGRIGSAREHVRDSGSATMQRASDYYSDNPAIGGLIAAALGAIVGAALPPSEIERQQLGSLGRQARDRLSQGKDRAMEKAQHMFDKSEGAGVGAGEGADGGTRAGNGGAATAPSAVG